jgi:hypothetical protein
MRAAEAMPWDEKRAALYRVIFPQMTNALPEQEGAQLRFEFVEESRSRKSAQDAKWSFCLTAGTLLPANQERACQDARAGTTHRHSKLR